MEQTKIKALVILCIKAYRRFFLFLCFSVLLSSSKCRKETSDCHHNIYLQNNTTEAVYISVSFNYPDTSITDPNPALSVEDYKIPPQRKKIAFARSSCIEDVFKTEIPSGLIQVFVFDASVIETTPWHTIKQNYLISKRYVLSLQDLQSNGFTISFL